MVKASDAADWLEWLQRIMAGDADAEAELEHRYKDGIAIVIRQIVSNESLVEDLSQETFRVVFEKLRAGEVREPERLSGFIIGVARYQAKDAVRRVRRATNREADDNAEQVRDSQQGPEEQLLRKERAVTVRQVISELKSPRDREVLSRFYIGEADKGQICADLGLNSLQFNSIISRAHKRFRELYVKRFGKP